MHATPEAGAYSNYEPSRVIDGKRCWHDLNAASVGTAATLELTFSAAVGFAAYDVFSARLDSWCPSAGYPTSWELTCKEDASATGWRHVDARAGIVVLGAQSSY